MDSDFIISNGKNDHLNFETYLNLGELEEGKHLLKIRRKRKRKEKIEEITEVLIPFWYFKNK